MKLFINNKKEITGGDSEWNSIAEINRANDLKFQNIIGKPYVSFITGSPMKMFMEALLTRVNVVGTPFVLYYRCDTGTHAQFMRLMIARESDETLSIEHELISRKRLSEYILFEEDLNAEEQRCTICGKVKFKDEWYDALTNRKIFGTIRNLATSSVICPACKEEYSPFTSTY